MTDADALTETEIQREIQIQNNIDFSFRSTQITIKGFSKLVSGGVLLSLY